MIIIKKTLKQTILFQDRNCDVWGEYVEDAYTPYQILGTDQEGIYDISVEFTFKEGNGESDKTLRGELVWRDSSNRDRVKNSESIQFNDLINGSYAKLKADGIYHKGGSKITLISGPGSVIENGNETLLPGLGNSPVEGHAFDCLITWEKIA